MKYICQTPTCAIAISKAAFPAAMACPVCSAALVELIESNELPEEDEKLIAALPYIIAYPLKRTLLEKHHWTKINLFKDTFLNYLKYLGLISASEFFNSPLKDKRMVALFQNTIAEPSFGTWNLFVRETLKYLNENKHAFFCPELNSYYEIVETGKKRKLYNGEIEFIDANGDVQLKKQEATAIGMLINFRNRYLGHGLTLDENISIKLWEEYFPIFRHLLEQMSFASEYVMSKHEHGETYLLQSSEIKIYEAQQQESGSVWITNTKEEKLDLLPFFIVPGEVSLAKEDKEQILAYESYTGKTIKFFSPEGTEKQSSGKILEKLNLLLRNKQKETPYNPETFTKEVFLSRIEEENKLLNDTLIAEKKVIPGIYVHREDIEIKLREWIGARASILFISAEAGSGKTNLLVEIQKQYTERNLPSLLIRAGRMEKPTIKGQIAYLLNIEPATDLSAYKTIAGTQNDPTFILIDGLNEAHNAEELWTEIIEITKLFEAGRLKFVVSSRANSKADLDRYAISETDLERIYGENSDNREGLSAYVNWLTPLNMKELNTAWDNYTSKDKARFKPQFKFDDIASFDRGLYNQISNPLVLRIFLEIYNGKYLPKKGIQHLNIWKDWLKTFSADEQVFFNLLANEIWEKGENELFLDDVLKNENLKKYLVSDNINSPYPRLKNLGWISRYTKDLNACIAFTVEGSLFHLLGQRLQNGNNQIDLAYINVILTDNNKVHRGGIEAYLAEKALAEDISLITELIDSGSEGIDLCINPLILYLKSYGSKKLIEQILENPTENDWKALLKLDKQLEELQLHIIRKDFLIELMPLDTYNTKPALQLGLKACSILDKEQVQDYLSEIDKHSALFSDDENILGDYADVHMKFGQYDKAIDIYQKSIDIQLEKQLIDNPKLATIYSKIGWMNFLKGKYDKALEFNQKCLDIEIKTLGIEHHFVGSSFINIANLLHTRGDLERAHDLFQKGLDILIKNKGVAHPDVATSYNNIGLLWKDKGEYDKALELYQKCLNIRLRNLGEDHEDVATTYNSMGVVWENKGEYDKAMELHQKCLNIQIKTFGTEHPSVATTYSNIGVVWSYKGEHNKALEFYHNCLDIQLKTLGTEHPSVATTYCNIGVVWYNKGEYDKALEFYQKCLDIELNTLGSEHHSLATSYNNIGIVWDDIGEYDKALEFYQKCLDIRLKTLGPDHLDVANSYNIIGSVWNSKGEYDKANIYFEKAESIQK